jgi:hypothetical protein
VAALQNLFHLIDWIFPHLEDSRDIACTRCVCKSSNEAGKNVRSVRYVCREKDYETRRKENACERALRMYISNHASQTAASENEGFGHKGLDHTGCKEQLMKRIIMPFRQVVEHDLRSKSCICQLRIEIEAELQSKSVPWKKRQQTDLWLSDPCHLFNWVPSAGKTLQHLCIVDYGQQAMTKKSYILKILSQNCEFCIFYAAAVLVLLWKCFSSCIARKWKLHSLLFPFLAHSPCCVHSKS